MKNAHLIQRCQFGDGQAMEILLKKHQPMVYRIAISILDDPAEAAGATQEALIAALEALGSYRGDSAFSTWLYTITVNVCRARFRKRRSRERLKRLLQGIFLLKSQDQSGPERVILQNEADAALWRAVNGLGEKHRLVVVLRYYHDLPIKEIAQILNVKEGTIHSRLYTARERLRTVLKENKHFISEIDADE
jgi:RNA polymerase sigma-70 factor (ECF subfamily)